MSAPDHPARARALPTQHVLPAADLLARTVREHRPRLVALLAVRTRDIAASEDAVGDAIERALQAWPRDGLPARPQAWLYAAARNRLADGWRHAQAKADHAAETLALAGEAVDAPTAADDDPAFPDERLKLLFVCAHPAIEQSVHAPLMLQVVMGVSAERIAAACLVKPAAMGQRLSRAKAKIRDAGIAFEVPTRTDWPARLPPVLDAIHAAYAMGWDAVPGDGAPLGMLAADTLDLGRLLAALLPDEPEALGLLALMLFCESRRAARRGQDGGFVPLDEQDPTRWDATMMREAADRLLEASAMRRPGRYQLEAAIQSVHAQRAVNGRTDWEALSMLYRGLVGLAPTIGNRLGQASVTAKVRGYRRALSQLEALPPSAVREHQPYWALRAHLLAGLGRRLQAREAYESAIALSADPAVQRFLRSRLVGMQG